MSATPDIPSNRAIPPVLIIPAPEVQVPDSPGKPDSARQLVLGLVFGLIFGFLLQKGGVAKYELLLGQFFLTDFTVMKIILTAIVVGMVGVFSMRAMGLIKLHVKPTQYASNIVGGLLFGIGMGLLGYARALARPPLGRAITMRSQVSWD